MADERASLPREIAAGIWWFGVCLELPHDGKLFHAYQSVYLIAGRDASLVIESGMPQDIDAIKDQFGDVLSRVAPVRYLWMTHQETPHAGGVGHLLHMFPGAELIGDVRDYHLYFPQYIDRMRPLGIGGSVDLGGREFTVVDSHIKDLDTTQWGFDSGAHALFPGDGFAYAHLHDADQCGHLAEEIPELDVAELAGFFAEHSLNWSRFRDMDTNLEALAAQVDELGIEVVGPTHGLPICDVPQILPLIVKGLQEVRKSRFTH